MLMFTGYYNVIIANTYNKAKIYTAILKYPIYPFYFYNDMKNELILVTAARKY